MTQSLIRNLKANGRKAVVVVAPTAAWPHMIMQAVAPDFYQSLQMSGFFPGAIQAQSSSLRSCCRRNWTTEQTKEEWSFAAPWRAARTDWWCCLLLRCPSAGATGQFFQKGAEARQKTLIGTSGKVESKDL